VIFDRKKKDCVVRRGSKVCGMEDEDNHDKSPFEDFDEDLTTLLYLLIVLMCVLMGESTYWCLYVVLLLNAAEFLCAL